MTTTQPVSDHENNGSANPENQQPPANDKVIDPADHDRAIQDMLKFKARAKAAEEKLENLSNEVAELKTASLQDKEDYKALYEAEVQAHKETKRRADGLKQNVSYSEKHRAVYPALKRAGLLDEAEKLLTESELDKLELEVTSSGRFNVIGIDTFVESFKNEYPFAFKNSQPPIINSGGNSNSIPPNKKITPQMVVAAEGTKEHAELLKRYLEQRNKQ
jgi:hypothetical protein